MAGRNHGTAASRTPEVVSSLGEICSAVNALKRQASVAFFTEDDYIGESRRLITTKDETMQENIHSRVKAKRSDYIKSVKKRKNEMKILKPREMTPNERALHDEINSATSQDSIEKMIQFLKYELRRAYYHQETVLNEDADNTRIIALAFDQLEKEKEAIILTSSSDGSQDFDINALDDIDDDDETDHIH